MNGLYCFLSRYIIRGYFLLLFIVLLLSSPCDAQNCKYWTLNDCIAYALDHNIEIKTALLLAENKCLTFQESKWAYAPEVSMSNSYNLSTGRVLDPTTYQFIENETVQGANSSIQAGVLLFGGMSNMHNAKRAKLDLKSALLNIEKIRNDIALNVTAYYLEILCAQENIRNAEQIVSTLEIQEKKTSIQVEAGKITTADLLQIQSQLASAKNEVFTGKNQLYIAKLNICQLLEIETYMEFETAPPENLYFNASVLPNSNDIVDSAMGLPQLEMAELDIDITHSDIRITRVSYYPKLSLSAAYSSSYSDARNKVFQNPDGTYRYEAYPFFEQYKDNANRYISISLNIPIFHRLSTRKKVQRAKISMQKAEYDLQTIKKQIIKEVHQVCIDANTAWEKYLLAQKYVATASEASRQISRKYEFGATSVIEYNTALDNLAKANSQLLQAKYEYIFKMKIINFYMGAPLSFINNQIFLNRSK